MTICGYIQTKKTENTNSFLFRIKQTHTYNNCHTKEIENIRLIVDKQWLG